VTYRPPVEAPVADPFRPPASRFGRGNRGLEYDTAPGQAVVAAAGGTVTFAGQVGGRLHVTVLHADGLRTTYGPLGRVAPGVRRGSRVEAGAVVGVAGELVLWTARAGSAYVDPAVLLAASGSPAVRLVPDRPLGRR
jgi:murein DD-endopeptidase MepM/ murein hydrolase activator NlpD